MQQQEQEIVLTQGEDGNWQMETIGFVGTECEKLGDKIADKFGETTGVTFKPEHGLTPVNTRNTQQQATRNQQRIRG